jgi:hypothetical protein
MYEPSLPAVVWPSGASCTRLRSDASVSYIAFVVEVSAVINWRFRFFQQLYVQGLFLKNMQVIRL